MLWLFIFLIILKPNNKWVGAKKKDFGRDPMHFKMALWYNCHTVITNGMFILWKWPDDFCKVNPGQGL